ncbi:MAG: MFS transporter [Acidimicrobiia bacterium]|nr:MFS transporter [Acidimicrobiia bacterium]
MESCAGTYQRRWWTLGVLSLALIAVSLDNMVLNVALPTIQAELGASASELIWMVDAYIVVFASLLLVMGFLGDRFGRALAMRVGLVIFGGASLAAAYAGTATELIAWRALMGVGSALIATASLSMVTAIFPREERGRAIGIWAGVNALGIGAGPVIGGVMLEHFWWGSVFLLNVPVVLVALAVGILLLPESRDPERRPLDLPGFVLSTAVVSTLVYALIEAPNRGWGNPLVLGAFAAALVLGGGFAWWERRIPHPLVEFGFFRRRRFSIGVTAVGLASFALFGTLFAFTQFLQFVQGYGPLEAGVRLIPISLGVMVGAGGADRLARRYGTQRVVAAGLALLGVLLASFLAWGPSTDYWVVGATFFAMAYAMGCVMAPATDAVMGAVPQERAGVATAMNTVSRMVAGALGAAVTGSVLFTIYGSRVAAATVGLPADLAAAARDSVGAAMQVAAALPPEAGRVLGIAAGEAFVDAVGLASLVGSAIALLGSALVGRLMPARHQVLEEGTGSEPAVLGGGAARDG